MTPIAAQTWFAQDGYIYQDALDGPTICELEEAAPEQIVAITAVPELLRAVSFVLDHDELTAEQARATLAVPYIRATWVAL